MRTKTIVKEIYHQQVVKKVAKKVVKQINSKPQNDQVKKKRVKKVSDIGNSNTGKIGTSLFVESNLEEVELMDLNQATSLNPQQTSSQKQFDEYIDEVFNTNIYKTDGPIGNQDQSNHEPITSNKQRSHFI